MPRYIAKYAHETDGAAEGLEHGLGSATITTDRPVTTSQQKTDIAREIGMSNGFTKVVVLTLADLTDLDDLEELTVHEAPSAEQTRAITQQ